MVKTARRTAPIPFPAEGETQENLLAQMRTLREQDVRWQDGRVFGLVYDAGEQVEELLKEAYSLFFAENGLNPTAFPSLRQFETEVVGMAIDLLGGDQQAAGNMTTGGTESLLMAVKTARDWARVHMPDARAPEMVLPATAHPGFDKAAHYFDVKAVRVPVGPDFRADVAAMEEAITPNTILMAGSAPGYPQGVVDPIQELAALTKERNLLFHVDACMGGFMLPFVRQLGYPVPEFDLSVSGVTSISADLHKYGYGPKGSSVILYADKAVRRHQLFVTTDWCGGVYASPTMSGSRPGGTIAASWAVLKYLGEAGYSRIAKPVMEAASRMQDGINAIDGLYVLGEPVMSVFAFGSDKLNIFEVGDEMTVRGWYLDRQQYPSSLHMTVNYSQVEMVDAFLSDLRESVACARKFSVHRALNGVILGAVQAAARLLPERVMSRLTERVSAVIGGGGPSPHGRSAALYGMMGTLPNRGDLRELVLDLVEGFTESAYDD
jgi:glutamate/tyrosine decarboxylase-like PLP-dependent enzyme